MSSPAMTTQRVKPQDKGTRKKSPRKLLVTAAPNRLNETLVGLLEELSQIEKSRGEPFKARAYLKAAESVMEATDDITSVQQMEGKKGVGKKIMEKFRQFEKEGDIDLLRRERNNPLVKLNEVHGIGPKKAQDLVSKYGIADVAALKKHGDDYVTADGKLVPESDKTPGMKPILNPKQKMGLHYFDDLAERIPRSEVVEYKAVFERLFSTLDFPGKKMEIVGSFRREKQNSGDIDVIVTDSNGNKTLLKDFATLLEKEKVIEAFLTRGATKIMAVARLPGKKACRLDLMFSPPDEYPFSILYFTGSASFNIGMRLRALGQGLSLSEHGLKRLDGGPAPDVSQFKEEADIFKYLGLKYKDPKARVNSESVVSEGAKVEAKPKGKPKRTLWIVSDEETEITIVPKKPASSAKKTVRKPKKATVIEHISAFRNQGADYLQSLTQKELEAMVAKTNEVYRNAASDEDTLLTDPQFDILAEVLQKRFPKSDESDCIGAPVERCKVKLPYGMYSMDKIKPNTGSVAKWESKMATLAKKRGDSGKPSYVITAKLDGVSGLYTDEGKPSLYTRGNGVEGQDVSNMISHIGLPSVAGAVVRGEFIFKKDVFEKKYAGKYANARNMVSGVVNSKKSADAAKYKDLDFIAYEVINPSMIPSEQIDFLKEHGFTTVASVGPVDKLSNEMLSDLLTDWRKSYDYEIDGVIVTDNNIHPRKAKNPEYSFAFKMVLSDQLAETVIRQVIWTPSEYGYLKPKLEVSPVTIGGATIKYVTANNAKFVVDNKIGMGTVIMLERAGDVIPKVAEVLQPSHEPQMPTIPYVWNDSHVDIMLEKPSENPAVQLRNLAGFFSTIDVVGLGPGSAKKLFGGGFNTISKVVHATEEEMQTVIGKANGTKIYESLHTVLPEVPMAKLMSASGIFGRGMGSKKIQHALDMFPGLLNMPDGEVAAVVNKVEGFAAKSSQQFSSHLPAFKEFLADLGISKKSTYPASADPKADGPLKGVKVVFSGGKYPEVEKSIVSAGGEVGSSVSKHTSFLVLKDVYSTSGKAKKARELGVPIVTVKDLVKQLGIEV
jgi:NAD-dependent DNA ligase/DNA polymerase/3'-5' exonuclease PolX